MGWSSSLAEQASQGCGLGLGLGLVVMVMMMTLAHAREGSEAC
jgi:hypothetical protein